MEYSALARSKYGLNYYASYIDHTSATPTQNIVKTSSNTWKLNLLLAAESKALFTLLIRLKDPCVLGLPCMHLKEYMKKKQSLIFTFTFPKNPRFHVFAKVEKLITSQIRIMALKLNGSF